MRSLLKTEIERERGDEGRSKTGPRYKFKLVKFGAVNGRGAELDPSAVTLV
jgi:hypothetical protein